ncbi:MAG TPA: DNA polymerase III subunit delta' [Candidatus Hydrogenedentes bacterium]|nr:DNA polymerase III subunit delta' [Candidatus Hydrogenedentota bacterium]HOL77692.1 DNA polymerase III subunit delta' [Candidatus Hydrogenedentota bacterium]HPO86815.1 DNA polymerase III subunit delta' [Candidatus Hydrogenedentota bacterium]
MSFSRIKDQEFAIKLIRRLLSQGRFPHALLFWGPEGVGKLTTAKELAKTLYCKNQGGTDSCDTCISCSKIEKGTHADVRYVVPVKKSRTIAVEAIEEIQELAALSPIEGDRRVFILQDADRLTAAAQHKFLKTLEEPPGKCTFILTSEYPGLLFATIRSRCQSIRFRILRTETVADILMTTRQMPSETALSIAALAQGQITRALELADTERRTLALEIIRKVKQKADPLELAREFTQVLNDQRKIIEAEIESELDTVEEQALSPDEKESLKEERMAFIDAAYRRTLMQYLYLLETWYRDELVLQTLGDASKIFNKDQKDNLTAQASSDPNSCIRAIETAREYLERQMNEERVFRNLFFDLAAKQ